MAQALELSVSKMSAPFLIWNWDDLPDDWKRPLDPVQLRAAAEELGYAPEKIGTRVGLECPDSPLARTEDLIDLLPLLFLVRDTV